MVAHRLEPYFIWFYVRPLEPPPVESTTPDEALAAWVWSKDVYIRSIHQCVPRGTILGTIKCRPASVVKDLMIERRHHKYEWSVCAAQRADMTPDDTLRAFDAVLRPLGWLVVF